jgi:hypothetical protein
MVLLACGVPYHQPAANAAPLYNTVLVLVPTRVTDTRGSVAPDVRAGVPFALRAAAVMHVSLISTSETTGVAVMHPCGTAPEMSTADIVVRPAIGWTGQGSNLLVPDDIANPCLTSTVDAEIIIDVVGSLVTGGPGYQPAAQPQRVLDVVLPLGVTARTPIADPRSGTQVGTAYRLDVGGLPGTGYATIAPCGASEPIAPSAHSAESTIVYTSAAPQCLYATAAMVLSVRLTLLGYLDTTVVPGAHRLPQLRFTTVEHSPPGLVARAPLRVVDTRELGIDVRTLSHDSDRVVNLSTLVPAGATAASFNLTVAGAVDDGFVTAYPCGAQRPPTSSINFVAGETVANFVTVALPADARVCLYLFGRTHLVVDFAGHFAYDAGSGFRPSGPTRLVDTRNTVAVQAGEILRIRPFDKVAPPSADSDAVAVNITATRTKGDGYLTAYPCAEPRPNASTVNFVAGQTRPNAATVKLDANHEVCVYAYATADVVVDLAGYFDPNVNDGVETVVPYRLTDSRGGRPLVWTQDASFGVAGTSNGLPRVGVTAALTNLTVTQPRADGFLTAYSCEPRTPPDASNVNYRANETTANFAIVPLSKAGEMCLASWAPSHYIVDVVGFVVSDGPIDVTPFLRA